MRRLQVLSAPSAQVQMRQALIAIEHKGHRRHVSRVESAQVEVRQLRALGELGVTVSAVDC